MGGEGRIFAATRGGWNWVTLAENVFSPGKCRESIGGHHSSVLALGARLGRDSARAAGSLRLVTAC